MLLDDNANVCEIKTSKAPDLRAKYQTINIGTATGDAACNTYGWTRISGAETVVVAMQI